MIAIATATIAVLTNSVAVYTDVRWGKILNAVTLPAVGLGLILNLIGGGLPGLWWSVQGLLLGAALLVLSALLGRILGGGDIKLLMAVGALMGPVFLAWALLYTALIGAALALAVGLYRGVLGQRLRLLLTSGYLRLTQGIPMEMSEAGSGPRLPYAIAIFLGTLVALVVLQLC